MRRSWSGRLSVSTGRASLLRSSFEGLRARGTGRVVGATGLLSSVTGSWLLACDSLRPLVLKQQFLQYLSRAGYSPGAVADDVLLVLRQLRHRRRVLRDPEYRVVAEAPLSPRRVRDQTEHLALRDAHGTRPRVRDHDHAAKASPSSLSRHIRQAPLDLGETLGVRGVCAEEARRVDAGLASEGFDLQAGGVGQRHEAASFRTVPGLHCSILLVCGPGLVGSECEAESGRCHELPAATFQEDVVFGDFAGIVRGEQKTGHGEKRNPQARKPAERVLSCHSCILRSLIKREGVAAAPCSYFTSTARDPASV